MLLYVTLVLGATLIVSVMVGVLRNRKDPVPPEATDQDVARIARTGDSARAIRWYRSLHGTGLRASKEAVERLAHTDNDTLT
jgi:ribosomal protein L7/L12